MRGEIAAKYLLYFGVLAFAGLLMRGIGEYPLTTAFVLLLMVPYPLMQFHKGRRSASQEPA